MEQMEQAQAEQLRHPQQPEFPPAAAAQPQEPGAGMELVPQVFPADPPQAAKNEALVQQIKDLQKNSMQYREAWHRFCDTEGEGVRDPGRHSAEYLQRFLACADGLAAQVAVVGVVPNPHLQSIANEIKCLQKTYREWRDAWRIWCDSEGKGLRDPSRHEMAFLHRFLVSHQHLPGFNPNILSLMGSAPGPLQGSASWGDAGAAVFAPAPSTVVPASGSRWDVGPPGMDGSMTAFQTMGTMPEAQLQAVGACGAMPSAAAAGPFPAAPYGTPAYPGAMMGVPSFGDDMVQRVKHCQRSSEEWKDAWHKLCDTEGGGVRDPSRHAAPLLQKFLEATERAGQTGASVHMLLGVVPMAPINHDLVAQVKQSQRSSERYKELWHRLCDAEGGGCRDPNRHCEEFLARYLAALKNPEMLEPKPVLQALREGGDQAGLAQRLAQEVKHIQRLSPEWNQEWERYCDSHGGSVRDPSRHELAFLSAFVERYESSRQSQGQGQQPQAAAKRPLEITEDTAVGSEAKRYVI